MDEPLSKILTVAGSIAAAIVGVAVIATIVGKNATTAATINAATGGLAKVISAAVAPVSGSGSSLSSVAPLGDLNSGIGSIGGFNASGITTAGNLINSTSGLYTAANAFPSISSPAFQAASTSFDPGGMFSGLSS